MPTIKQVGIVGSGTMGGGIAQVVAIAGYKVYLSDRNQETVERGFQTIKTSINKAVEKRKLSRPKADDTLKRIQIGSSLNDHSDMDLVIEAIFEDIVEKKNLFAQLDEVCQPSTLFASNTSSMCITEMAAVTRRPEQIVGMHFFNPAPIMKLVEVVRTVMTSKETFETAWNFVSSIGKEAIASEDKAGFVVDRLLVPYLMESVRALEERVASIEDIDKGMQLGCGFPMGPFTLMDLVGLDICYNAAITLYDEYREKSFQPPPLLKRMVQAGQLGRKTGKGFYSYE